MQHSTDSVVALILPADNRGGQERDWLASLSPIAHLPAILHVIRTLDEIDVSQVLVSVDDIERANEISTSIQSSGARVLIGNPGSAPMEPLRQLESELEPSASHVLVLLGVRPLVRPATLHQLVQSARENGGAAILHPADHREAGVDSGPVVRDNNSSAPEHKSRSRSGREIKPIAICLPSLDIPKVAADEHGVTEYGNSDPVSSLVDAIRERKGDFATCTCAPEEAMPIESPADCSIAESCFQSGVRTRAARDGVIMHGPETVWFSHDTVVEPGAVLEPVIVFGPGVTVRVGATIRAFSHLEGCVIERGAVVGPHARLRPGTTVAEGARVGNFVEVKASAIGAGTKVNHLSYIGDSLVGDGANVGAGTITCNYDGVSKHQTVIGEKAFVGSHSTLVAPVRIGTDSMTAAGTVVTRDVPDDALAIGRTVQENKPGMARQLMARPKPGSRKRP